MRINGINVRVVETDLLIIGTEATGGKAALEAAEKFPECRITVVNKQVIARSAVTITAVATYNAAVNPYDDPDIHTVDTINGGSHLADQTLAKLMCDVGAQCVHELEAWGCRFARQEKNPELYDCFEYPGHSKARGAYTFPYGTTGRKMVQIMKRQIFKQPNITVMNDVYISDMLMADGKCVGAVGVCLIETWPVVIRAKAVIIGAGGGMEIFRNSDAARDAVGNGYGWAYRAGGTLVDMELCQFFPTNVVTPKTMYAQQPVAVIRYALGARLYNSKGERFMHRYDPVRGEYSTRDLTSRAMWMEILEGRGGPNGGVYLSVAHLPDNLIDDWVAKNNPGYNFGGVKLEEEGVDIKHDALEVAPMAHFYLGGIKINGRCETDIPGMYAAGEVAGNVHGANRLGGNALTDCQVFGKIAGAEAAEYASEEQGGYGAVDEDQVKDLIEKIDALYARENGTPPHETRNRIRDAMYEVSLVKHGDWIENAMGILKEVKENELPAPALVGKSRAFSKELMLALENEDLLLTAELHLKGALMREETRGAQCRLDFPDTDNENWCKNIHYRKDGDDVKIWTEDVDFHFYKPDWYLEREKETAGAV